MTNPTMTRPSEFDGPRPFKYDLSRSLAGRVCERDEVDPTVKLVIAIVQDRDAGKAVDGLIGRGFGATRINTAGGFLKRGNSTILTGVQDEETHDVIQILRDTCGQPTTDSSGNRTTGVVFVLPVTTSFKM